MVLSQKSKIVFMGTPKFAESSLRKLLGCRDRYDVALVLTQPDKPQGRKKVIFPSPVKILSKENKLKVFQPESLKSDEVFETLSEEQPDFIVVAAYGKILPKRILELPKYGAINVHGSLLPKYRGAAPIQWSFINGEKIFGVTTMFMNEGLDTGDIIFQRELEVEEDESFTEVYLKLAEIGANLLVETLDFIKENYYSNVKLCERQDDSKATFAPLLNKKDAKINWKNSALKIHNLVRGCCEWPVSYTLLNGKMLKIYKTKISENVDDNIKNGKEGLVLDNDKHVLVNCGDETVIEILELQLEGKKRMKAENFLIGNNIIGKTLG